jgi:hypothetical protein
MLNALNIKNVTDRFWKYDGSQYGTIGYDYDIPIVPILGAKYDF